MFLLHISPWHCHRYTNILLHWTTVILCTCITVTRILILHVLVSSSTSDTPVHWTLYFMYILVTLDIVISCAHISDTPMLYYTEHCYFIYMYHHCIDIISSCSHIVVTWIHIYTCFNCSCLHDCSNHCSCYMIYCYMNIHVFLWHEYLIQYMIISYITVLIWNSCYLNILPIDIRCVELSATWMPPLVSTGGHL